MASFTDISTSDPIPTDLTERTKAGEVFVIRGALQRLGLFEEIKQTTLDSISEVCGPALSRAIDADGIEMIHKHVDLPKIESITAASYARTAPRTFDWASRIARDLFHISGAFYFERRPNVRFHVPFDILAKDKETLKKFASARGGGKLSAHPNHRDSWVGCPDNLINIWAAVAPIRKENGLIVFPDAFNQDIRHVGASIARDENPGEPVIPELDAGDAIIFQGDHLHSSVLNRIDETRHAISFRIVTERPNFSNGHYHHYLHSKLANGPFRFLAEVPANLAWSYVGTRLGWLAERLSSPARRAAKPQPEKPKDADRLRTGERTFALGDLAQGDIRAITDDICVARVEDDKVIAFARRCPHGGSDLSLGTVTRSGQVACPWHDLPFDSDTGASPCKSLSRLRMYPVRVEGQTVTVSLASERAIAAE